MERGLSKRHLHRHSTGSSPAPCRRNRYRGRKLSRPRERAGSGCTQEEKVNTHPVDANPASYVPTVLALYLSLPETPIRTNAMDHRHARLLQQRDISLRVVESAFLLASLRRLIRPKDLPPLSPIRSLAYFLPVITELLVNPAPANYLEYLRLKLRHTASGKIMGTGRGTADVQKP